MYVALTYMLHLCLLYIYIYVYLSQTRQGVVEPGGLQCPSLLVVLQRPSCCWLVEVLAIVLLQQESGTSHCSLQGQKGWNIRQVETESLLHGLVLVALGTFCCEKKTTLVQNHLHVILALFCAKVFQEKASGVHTSQQAYSTVSLTNYPGSPLLKASL